MQKPDEKLPQVGDKVYEEDGGWGGILVEITPPEPQYHGDPGCSGAKVKTSRKTLAGDGIMKTFLGNLTRIK